MLSMLSSWRGPPSAEYAGALAGNAYAKIMLLGGHFEQDVWRVDSFCGLMGGKRKAVRNCPGVRGAAAEKVRVSFAVPVLAGGGFILKVASIIFAPGDKYQGRD
jgi:hypothetical protein